MKRKKKAKKLPWTKDPQEIERRLVAAGLMKHPLIWPPSAKLGK